jgi:hypothetical protein
MRASALAVLVLAGVVATGSAHARPKPNAKVDLGGKCADSVAELVASEAAFKASPKDKFKPRQFGDVGQCLVDARGERVPAALFALGAKATAPLTIRVELYGSTVGTLAAAVAVLDAQFKPLRSFGFEQFTKRSLDYSLTTFINADMADARYVLITPDPTAVGRTSTLITGERWTAPIITPAAVGAYSDGMENVVEAPLEAAGKLHVIVEPYAERTFGK